MAFISGQVVRGANFFDRKYELEDIWEAVQNGEHPLLVAPRKVGKTSIMHNDMGRVGWLLELYLSLGIVTSGKKWLEVTNKCHLEKNTCFICFVIVNIL